jgi:hypothetical protein
MSQTSPAVCAHDDQISLVLRSLSVDFNKGRSRAQHLIG